MAKRNGGRRARSRKRRAASQAGGVGASAPVGKQARPRGAAERASGGFKAPQSLGERPQAPWHPLPLSELLILVGAIGAVVGLSREAPPTFLAGFGAVALGTAEVTWREHRSGYRSHTVILALLPTIIFHSALVLLASAFVKVPRAANLVLLPIDGALFAVLFKLLRAQFLDERRERRFAGER